MATATQAPMNQYEPTGIVDDFLTTVARGYRSRLEPLADILFPRVAVQSRSGKVLEFSADDFRLLSSVRALGANTKRISYGFGTTPFVLEDYRLEATCPVEMRNGMRQLPRLDLLEGGINRVRNSMAREREKEAADLALNPANYAATNKVTLTGSDQWTDPASDPFTDIMDAAEAIRVSVGERPNVLALGPRALRALRTHEKVMSRLSTSTDRAPATRQQLQALFEVDQIVEGTTTYHDGTRFRDVWGNSAVLAFTTPGDVRDMGSPNFGYTYQLDNYPVVEEPYIERNPNVWAAPVADARRVVLVGPLAGFLFINPVPAA